MANVNAELGLLITAKDEASGIFESFASTLRTAFSSVTEEAQAFKNSFDGVASAESADATRITESMVKIEESLAGVSVEMNNTGNSARDMNEKFGTMATAAALQDIGARFTDVGKKITGFFGNAIEEGATFQQKMDAVAATLNSHLPESARLSADAFQAMSDKALEMGKSGYFSANQLADAMYTLARQGIDYKDIMNGAMDSVQNLAVATDSDLTATANVVSDVTHEMATSLKEEFGDNLQAQFTTVANVISGATHNARMSMDDFLNSMKMAGPLASESGMKIEDMSVALSLLAEGGLKGTQAGTSLRKMILSLAAPTKTGSDELKQLGLMTKDGASAFYDANGKLLPFVDIQQKLHDTLGKLNPQMQAQAEKAIFGTTAISGLGIIVGTSSDKMNELTTDVLKNSNAQDLAKAKWDNTAGSVRALNAHFQTIVKQIGTDLLPVVDKLVSVGQKLLSWFDSLSPSARHVVEAIAAIAGVITLVLGFLATLGASFMFLQISLTALAPIFTIVTGGFEAVGAAIAFIGGPVTIAIAAIGLIVAALVMAYNKCDWFRNGVNYVFNEVKNAIGAALNWIGALFDIKFQLFIGAFKIFGDLMTGHFSNALSDLKSMVSKIFADIGTIIGQSPSKWAAMGAQMVDNLVNQVASLPGKLGNFAKQAISSFGNILSSIHPHLEVSGNFDLKSLLSGNLPSMHFSMFADGGIMMNPTMFGMNGGTGMVGGEAGPEAILPISKLPELLGLPKDGLRNMVKNGTNKTHVTNITITVNGAGKDGNQIGNDLARQIRLQMPMVSV